MIIWYTVQICSNSKFKEIENVWLEGVSKNSQFLSKILWSSIPCLHSMTPSTTNLSKRSEIHTIPIETQSLERGTPLYSSRPVYTKFGILIFKSFLQALINFQTKQMRLSLKLTENYTLYTCLYLMDFVCWFWCWWLQKLFHNVCWLWMNGLCQG